MKLLLWYPRYTVGHLGQNVGFSDFNKGISVDGRRKRRKIIKNFSFYPVGSQESKT